MSDEKREYSVRLGDPEKADSLRTFALAVSTMLVRLAGRIIALEHKTTTTSARTAGITKGGVFTGVGIVLSDAATGVVINGKTYTRTPVLAADGVTVVYALASATGGEYE